MKKALLFALFLAGCATAPAPQTPSLYERFKAYALEDFADAGFKQCAVDLKSENPDGSIVVQLACEDLPAQCTLQVFEDHYNMIGCEPRPQTKGV